MYSSGDSYQSQEVSELPRREQASGILFTDCSFLAALCRSGCDIDKNNTLGAIYMYSVC